MIKKIIMPAGGQTTDQSLVAEWFVRKGDRVKRGDPLLNVETDKTVLTVESFAAGIVIDILIQQGETASAGAVLAVIGDEEDLENYSKKEDEAAAVPDTVTSETEDEYRPIMPKSPPAREEIKAMPNARKYARENGIDLIAFANSNGMKTVKLSDLKNLPAPKQPSGTKEAGCSYSDLPHSMMRRTIARRMLESTQNIPAYQITIEVDMASCIEYRTTLNARQNDAKIGYNDIIMKAVAMAVQKFPLINASWTETAVRQYNSVNIGLAVSLDGGLVVPVITEVEKLGILQIARETTDKISKARGGKLDSGELTGGTITLSNLGMYSIQNFTAIINPPEACILALGSIQDKFVVRGKKAKIMPVMTITASFDHRVIDGAYGARFLQELKQLLEVPALLIC